MKLYLKALLALIIASACIWLVFEGLSVLFRPDLPEKTPPVDQQRLKKVRELRTVDWDRENPPVVYRQVDYSRRRDAPWYPKNQAPLLEELVEEGKLPPLEERITPEPVVLEGVDGVHNYGGTWMRLAKDTGDAYSIMNRLGYANLVRFSPHGYPIVPHVAKEFEVFHDNTTFTFTLRKGMKWSDGEPFTADDIMYHWKYEQNDKSIRLKPDSIFSHNGKPAKFTKINDLKFKIEFEDPYGQFLERLAGAYGRFMCNSPEHYLRQFHPKLGKRELIDNIKGDRGYNTDKQVYLHVLDPVNPELPRITPWLVRKSRGITSSEAVRNPYYWAVDPEGNQLPYIDRIFFRQHSLRMLTLAAAEGAVSMQNKFIDNTLYSLLMNNAEKSDYSVYHWVSANRNSAMVHVNQNYRPTEQEIRQEAGDEIRDLLRDVRFRRALSLALDREAIITGLYDGRTEPANAVPGPQSPFYDEEAFKAYTQYDPQRAAQLLDEIGLTGRDSEGFRTTPRGRKLTLYLCVAKENQNPGQIIVDYWRDAHLRVMLKVREDRYYISQLNSGRLQLFIWGGYQYFPPKPPMHAAIAYQNWYTQGGLRDTPESKEGFAKAPPPGSPMLEFIKAYDNAKAQLTPEDLKPYVQKMSRLMAQQQWTINISTPLPQLCVVKNGFMNVPKHLLFSWTHQTPGNGGVETYCFAPEYLAQPKVRRMDAAVKEDMRQQILHPIITEGVSTHGSPAQGGQGVLGTIIKWMLVAIVAGFFLLMAVRHPFVSKRLIIMVPTLLAISVIVFVVIQLPTGNYVTSRIAELQQSGEEISNQEIEKLKEMYYLNDQPVVQYAKWMGFKWFFTFDKEDKGLLQGDMGRSMQDDRSVNEKVGDRILLTFLVSLFTIMFTWALAIPIGIYSAVRQYSISDYVFTFLGFIGMCIPGYLLALLLMLLCDTLFGFVPTGLFSQEMAGMPHWSWAKVVDLFKHIWMPVIVMGIAGTAGLIRVMRANLLDELRKPYVITARAKGVRPVKLLFKYPVRLALNPFVSGIGNILPMLISGGAIVAIVLSLPTVGPMLLNAVMIEDMYLAGSLLLMLSLLSVIGILISDLLLMAIDPRIRYENKAK